MSWRHPSVAIALITLLAAGCTSEHGALPAPTSSPSPTPTSEGLAPQALLSADDLPDGFAQNEIDVADRWDDVVKAMDGLTPVRPNCTENLDGIVATLGSPPADSAGVAFTDEDGREIVQFTGISMPDTALGFIDQLDALNAECDAYVLQVPDGGSLAASVHPVELEERLGPTIGATAWETTSLSGHLRSTMQYAAVTADGVVSLIAVSSGDVTGAAPLSDHELESLIDSAIDQAEEVG